MNQKLPIFDFKDRILETIQKNAVTIITAETGAGKSTQVPQFLMREGLNIVVTQPRRLAARTVAERVAEEFGCDFGAEVGFRTAYEKCDSSKTQCLFVTDGLALVRELMGQGQHQILVLDEVHEWNINMEVLVAWAKLQIESGANFKVVIMSATMEAEKLSEFFGGAPVINVPGRLFPVDEEKSTGSIAEDTLRLIKAGRNVLVFQPGKREIEETISKVNFYLEIEGGSAAILPLHGELEVQEQKKCFKHYDVPKCVVATNVAQTSVTIDDIDAVVDSGQERRVETISGIEGLYLRPISFADAEQRKGRAGRTHAGIYVDHCPYSDSERLEFPKAEILRVRLDQTVLRLAIVGIDMEELQFFHQPEIEEITAAKKALRALGCMDEKGAVTGVGRRVANMPISVQFGRMVVEAEKLGVVDDVVDIAALLEQGSITVRYYQDDYGIRRPGRELWGRLCPGEDSSDVMAQLAVYHAALEMNKSQMKENGVFIKAFFQAKEKRHHLAQSLKGKIKNFKSSHDPEQILRAVCAGMVEHLFRYDDDDGTYINGDDQSRQLARESVVEEGASWLVGIPFDLEVENRRGKVLIRLVTMATTVEPMWLAEVAPQLVRVERGIDPFFDEEKDSCVSTQKTFFQDQMIEEKREKTPEHPQAGKVFANWLARQMVI